MESLKEEFTNIDESFLVPVDMMLEVVNRQLYLPEQQLREEVKARASSLLGVTIQSFPGENTDNADGLPVESFKQLSTDQKAALRVIYIYCAQNRGEIDDLCAFIHKNATTTRNFGSFISIEDVLEQAELVIERTQTFIEEWYSDSGTGSGVE